MATVPANLRTLCLRNCAFNLVRHGERLKKVRKTEIEYIYYKILGSLFSMDLMEILEHTFRYRQFRDDDSNSNLFQFLFCGKQGKNESLKDCLSLLFNEHTHSLCFDLSGGHKVSEGLFRTAFSQCKNLKIMTLKLYNLGDIRDCIPSLRFCSTLIKVDLMHTNCDDTVTLQIITYCLHLQVFKASGSSITELSFFLFCAKYHGKYDFCVYPNCNGLCTNVGKQLKTLVLYNTSITPQSAAWALLHFPALEVFHAISNDNCSLMSIIPEAVAQLRRQAFEAMQLAPCLNLKSISFNQSDSPIEILTILNSCPKINSVCFNITLSHVKCFTASKFDFLKIIYLYGVAESQVTSPKFQRFLARKGHQLETVGIWGKRITEILDVKFVSDILTHCKNLKKFFLSRICICDRLNADGACNYPGGLEKISLMSILPHNELVLSFFSNLLNASLEVECLNLSKFLGEQCLIRAMNKNFTRLENLSLHEVSLNNVLLTALIHKNSRLKKITLLNCSGVSEFTEMHNTHARHSGVPLVIDAFRIDSVDNSSFCYDIYD